MAERSQTDRIADLLNKLGISGHQLQNVKLGPGVVGRNSSIAWAFEFVMLAGVVASAILHSIPMLGLSLAGAICVAVAIALSNVYFGNKNPAAALLEGAQFLEYQQMQMAAKGVPVIESSAPPVPRPPTLTQGHDSEARRPELEE
jgi:hypothetical protein